MARKLTWSDLKSNVKPRGSRIDWSQAKLHVIANESIQATLILFALAIGTLQLPMLFGLWMLELVIITALSASFFPQRGRVRALMDVGKMVFLCAFLSVFLIGLYLAGKGQLRLEWWSILSAAALLCLRLATTARSAKQAPDPKIAWVKAATVRGGVVLIGMFLGIFACLPAIYVAGALYTVIQDVAPDVSLGLALLAVQLFLAVVASTMTEAELKEIARNPYID